MSEFKYTDYFSDSRSQVVHDAWYNENNKELLINLNDYGYIYQDISPEEFVKFRAADSHGNYYSTYFKQKGRSAARAGYVGDIIFKVTPKPVPYPTAGTPKGLTDGNNVRPLNVALEKTFKYSVKFEVNGSEKVHNLRAASVNDALEQLDEIADMLDLEFNVKEATVYFE